MIFVESGDFMKKKRLLIFLGLLSVFALASCNGKKTKVSSYYLNDDGNLIVVYDDNKEEDLGKWDESIIQSINNVSNKNDLKVDFELLKTKLTESEAKYKSGIAKYNEYYEAIVLGHSDKIKPDMESSDSDIAMAAKEFYELSSTKFERLKVIRDSINKSGCGMDATTQKRNSAECLAHYSRYSEVAGDSMSNSAYITAIFKNYYMNINNNNQSLSNLIILVGNKANG